MVYIFPDWSRTTSSRMLIADSEFDGAGPYLQWIFGHESGTVLSPRRAAKESAQYGNAQHGYVSAFDTKHGQLGVALCYGIQVEWVRFCRGDIGWRGTVEDIIC
jgi:hypothetical protein